MAAGAPTPGSWKPGQSGNPLGRARGAMTLAQAMRKEWPVERIVAEITKIATGTESEEVRLRALTMISERAHGKVPDKIEISRGPDADQPLDLAGLSVEQIQSLREMLLSVGVTPLALPGAAPTFHDAPVIDVESDES